MNAHPLPLTLSGPTLLAGGRIDDATLALHNGHITAVRPGIERTADIVTSGLIAPGFIDLQLNGGFGCDFTADPASIAYVAARLPQTGVTGFLPTCVTSPIDSYAWWLDTAAEVTPGAGSAHVLGVHLEGVYFSPHKMGAHNPAYMRPVDVEEMVTRYAGHPLVRIVTLAPELPGALDAIRALRQKGIIASAGHSNATYAEARLAIEAGIGWGTHLFNAMRDLRQREPGITVALMLSDVPVGLIADGVHLHPAVVEMAWRLKGAHRITLVTDAMAAMGMPAGVYNLGGYDVTVDEHSARLANGTLAGSILTMDGAIRHLVNETACLLADALTMASRTPADLLGLTRKGRIAEGCDADLVVLGADLGVQTTLVGGGIAFGG